MVFALGFIALFTIGGLINLLAHPLNITICLELLIIILLGFFIFPVKMSNFEQSAGNLNQRINKNFPVGASETIRNPFDIKVRYSP